MNFIVLNLRKSIHFIWMENIITQSFIDLGHTRCPTINDSELVLAIRYGGKGKRDRIERQPNKKYILFQTEQISNVPERVSKAYRSFPSDQIWGFDIDNKREVYTPLGYHPSCVRDFQVTPDIDVSFLGVNTIRREAYFNSTAQKVHLFQTWDIDERIRMFKRSKINLNIHAYSEGNFTQWERISHFLSNKCFFISENMYCDLPVVKCPLSEISSNIDKYLHNDQARLEITEKLYNDYVTNFDMRKIIDTNLRRL